MGSLLRLSADSRKWISTVMAALVVIAAVPVLVMIGCSMDMSATGGVCSHSMEVFTAACGGTYVMLQNAAAALVTSGLSTLLFALLALFMMAVIVLAPASQSRAYVLVTANPPPPPEDPLGVRLTL